MNTKVAVTVAGVVIAAVGAGFGVKKLADRKRVRLQQDVAFASDVRKAQQETESILEEMKQTGEQMDQVLRDTQEKTTEAIKNIQKRQADFKEEAEARMQKIEANNQEIEANHQEIEQQLEQLDKMLDDTDTLRSNEA